MENTSDMSTQGRRNCPYCGAHVEAGATRCPNGHECTWEFGEVESAGWDDDVSFGSLTSGASLAIGDELFECRTCERLVDAQLHHGMKFVPNFCPWCGQRLAKLIGRELDGYRLESLISQGGFGLVYLAANVTQPSMKSVVKVLRPSVGYAQPRFIKVFVEEARLTESIGQSCWNIVRVHNVRQEPWPYFFMEYVRGDNLDDVIRDGRGRLPLRECIGYLQGIARALSATHANRRVHRDLKPLNIMVLKDEQLASAERIKVLDFGLAMKTEAKRQAQPLGNQPAFDAPDASGVGTSVVEGSGTPEYMAPEAFDGKSGYEADLYSFGVTAYQMLTGRRPWKDPPPTENRLRYWADCHKTKTPQPIRELRKEVPTWLAATVMLCLEKNPTARVQSAEALINRLRPPLPRWIWIAAAAALIAVGILTWNALFTLTETPIAWHLNGERLHDRTIYIADAKSLARVELQAALDPSAADAKWSTSHSAARVEADGEHVRVTFDAATGELPSLIDRELQIEGRARSFLNELILSGDLSIAVDAKPPRVSERIRLAVASGEPLDVRSKMRLRRDAALLVSIRDARLHEAQLHVQPVHRNDRRSMLVAGSRHDGDMWKFPLQALSPGEYEIYVEATDRARNVGSNGHAAIRILVDEECGFTILPQDPIVVAGKAFFQMRANEKLSSLEVRSRRERVPFKIFPNVGAWSPFELHASLETSLRPLELNQIRPDVTFLLAIDVVDPQLSAWTIHARDTAQAAPNEIRTEAKLTDDAAEPFDDDDVLTITVSDPEIDLASITTDFLAPLEIAASKVKKIRTARSQRGRLQLDELKVFCTAGRIVSAACSHTDRVTVTPNAVVFRDIELPLDVPVPVVMRFEDKLERIFARQIVVEADTQAPTLTPELSSGRETNPLFHDTHSGRDVSLAVTSSEPLTNLTAVCNNNSSKLKSANADSTHFRLETLEAFKLSEGDFEVRFEAVDQAGHVGETSVALSINPSAPKTTVSAREEGGILQLGESDELPLTLTDENGVDPQALRINYRLVNDRTQLPLAWRRVDEDPEDDRKVAPKSMTIAVELSQLPNRCKGVLIFFVADKLGRRDRSARKFTFERSERWKARVEWRDMTWILCTVGDRNFYISRTEVTNGQFMHPKLFDRGSYRDATLRRAYERPKYWTETKESGDHWPEYWRGGRRVSGERFPVTGIGWKEAEAYARIAYGARLPTWEEWLSAAQLGNPNARFPWPDEAAGERWVNSFCRSKECPDSELWSSRLDFVLWRERRRHWHLVESDLDPFPPQLAETNRALTILHQVGNVRELVRYQDEYRAVGGSFDTPYEQCDLRETPRDAIRFADTGFRVVIDLDQASASFIDAAR